MLNYQSCRYAIKQHSFILIFVELNWGPDFLLLCKLKAFPDHISCGTQSLKFPFGNIVAKTKCWLQASSFSFTMF